jgi:hypothetical protein
VEACLTSESLWVTIGRLSPRSDHGSTGRSGLRDNRDSSTAVVSHAVPHPEACNEQHTPHLASGRARASKQRSRPYVRRRAKIGG